MVCTAVLLLGSISSTSAQDTTPPELKTAAINGGALLDTQSKLELTYSEPLDETSIPATGDFTVSIIDGSLGTESTPSVSNVSVSGRQVILTVEEKIDNDDSITLDYTPGTDPIQDTAGNDAANLTDEPVTNTTADGTAPTISGVNLSNDGSNTLVFSFDSDEQLGAEPADIVISVDGPSTGVDWTSFNRDDFTESGSGPYTYTLSTSQAFDDGDGNYTAAVDDAIDLAGNDGADGSQTNTHDFSPPSITNVALGEDASENLTLSFDSDQQIGGAISDLSVTVDGPNNGSGWPVNFDRSDFAENGTGPYTYTLTTSQAYDDGDGTYTAAIDDALDVAGNDGADGSQADTHEFDGTPPSISSVTTLDRDSDGKTDAAKVVFSEPIDDSSITPGDYNLAGATIDAVNTGSGVDDDTIQLRITLDNGNEVAGTDAKDIAYTQGTTADLAGNLLDSVTSGDVTETDGAAPTITDLEIHDTANDGLTDKIIVTFSENIDTNDGAAPTEADFETAITMPDGTTAELSGASVSDPGGTSNTVTISDITDQNSPNTATDSTGIDGDLSANWADGAGNALTSTLDNETVTDSAPPTFISAKTADNDANGKVDQLTVLFSEAVTSGSIEDADFSIGSSNGLSGFLGASSSDDGDENVLFSITEGDNFDTDAIPTLSYNQNGGGTTKVADKAGNLMGDATSSAANDGAMPVMTSATTADNNGNGQIDAVTVQYSESVDITDGDATDGLPGFSVSSPAYTIASTDYGATGVASLTLELVESGSSDTDATPTVSYDRASSNSPTVADPAANEQTDGDSQSSSDETKPQVVDMSKPSDGTYAIGETLSFNIVYSETVSVDESGGTPSIVFDIDGDTANETASYSSGTGTTTLTFNYMVASGDDDTDGINFSSTSVQNNGGNIRDGVGNDAGSDFSTVAPDLSNVNTDGTIPFIQSVSITENGANELSVSFNEEVWTSNGQSGSLETADFSFTDASGGSVGVTSVSHTAGNDSATVTLSGDAEIGNDELAANTGEIFDGAGNAAENTAVTVTDEVAPTELTVEAPSTRTFRSSSQSLDVSYSYNEANPSAATVTFDDGSGNAASYNIDDSAYPGDNTTKTVTLDLSNPDGSAGSGLTDGNTYDFTVKASDVSSNNTSKTESGLLSIDNSSPASPDNATAEAVVDGNISISFDDVDESGSGVSNYSVRRSTTSGGPYSEVGTVTDDESASYTFTDSSTVDGTTYYYVIVAVDGVENESTHSTETSATADATSPALDTATITDQTLTLAYDESLDTTSVPVSGDLEVTVNGSTVNIDTTDVSGLEVVLTLATAVASGDDVSLSYTPGSDPIRDLAGNQATGLSDQVVENLSDDTTPPLINNVTLNENGNNIALSFDSDEQLGKSADDIAASVDGPATANVYLFDRTDFGETDNGDGTFTYTLSTSQAYDDGDGTYTAAIDDALDVAGNDGADGSQADTHEFDGTPPVLQSASVTGTDLELTYNEILDENSVPVTGDFAVKSTGVSQSVAGVSINGENVALTLDPGVNKGDNITLDYTAGSTPIQDASGNQTADLTDEAVTNNTAGDVSLSKSTITASEDTLVADTANTATITVQLKDKDGSNLSSSGGTVTLSADSGSLGDVIDNGDGTYTANYTAPTSTGTSTITGQLDGEDLQDEAKINLIAGAAANLLISSGDGQSNPVGTTLDDSLFVKVTDKNDNAVPDFVVDFVISGQPNRSSGASLNAANDTTGSNGLASVELTLGDKTGTYIVTASDSELNPVEFSAEATAGLVESIIKINGDNQEQATLSTLDDSLKVQLKDKYDNPVPNHTVYFSVKEQPKGAENASLSRTKAISNSQGFVTSSFKLGDEAGTYTVSAITIGNDDTLLFTATGLESKPDPTVIDTANTVVFDGNKNTFMFAESDASLDTLKYMTAELWLLPHSLTSSYEIMKKKDSNGPGNSQFSITGEENSVLVELYVSGGDVVRLRADNFFKEEQTSYSKNPSAMDSPNKQQENEINYQWTHLSIVVDRIKGNAMLLRNGIALDKTHFEGMLNSSSEQLKIGAGFDGEIHEVRIWNRNHSSGRIQSNMNSILSGEEEGLVFYHLFNGEDKTVSDDKTSHDNDLFFKQTVRRSNGLLDTLHIEVHEDNPFILSLKGVDDSGVLPAADITELPQHGKLFQVENDGQDRGNEITSVPARLTDSENRALYQPDPFYFGEDSLAYALEDSLGNRAKAVKQITVLPINNAPKLNFGEEDKITFNQRDTVRVDLTCFVEDVDNTLDELIFAAEVLIEKEQPAANISRNALDKTSNQLKSEQQSKPDKTGDLIDSVQPDNYIRPSINTKGGKNRTNVKYTGKESDRKHYVTILGKKNKSGKASEDSLIIEVDQEKDELIITTSPTFSARDIPILVETYDPDSATDSDTLKVTVKQINDSPSPFRLLEPIDNDTVKISDVNPQVTMKWEQSTDFEQDTIRYIVRMEREDGEVKYFENIQDTVLTVNRKDPFLKFDEEYIWKVKATDKQDTTESIAKHRMYVVKDIPLHYRLKQNYPNPYNPTTTIEFWAPVDSRVEITLYNIIGQKVAVLVHKQVDQGLHTITLNALELGMASGVYLYHMKGEAVNRDLIFVKTKKMTLIK